MDRCTGARSFLRGFLQEKLEIKKGNDNHYQQGNAKTV